MSCLSLDGLRNGSHTFAKNTDVLDVRDSIDCATTWSANTSSIYPILLVPLIFPFAGDGYNMAPWSQRVLQTQIIMIIG
jgi:hypothetical protein